MRGSCQCKGKRWGTGTPCAGMGMLASAHGTVAWDTPNSKKRTRKDEVLAPR